jgi:hypothetical protein
MFWDDSVEAVRHGLLANKPDGVVLRWNIDELSCGVIVKWWEEFTNKQAKRITANTEEWHD